MIWQYSYINRLLDLNYNCLSDALNDNGLIDSKLDFLPQKLFRFYSPTEENILDIRNRRIWLSSPTAFNDPFECSVGFNVDEYIKSFIIKFALKEQKGYHSVPTSIFTKEDLCQIYDSYTKDPIKSISKKKSFSLCLMQILQTKDTSFQNHITHVISKRVNAAINFIDNIRLNNYRIACFSADWNFWKILDNLLLWAHYTRSHQGFCVEYDISNLQNGNNKYIQNDSLYNQIILGLFPVYYNNKRIQMSKTIIEKHYLDKIDCNDKKSIQRIRLRSLISKSINWNYEKEWRLIIDNKTAEYYSYKIPFPFIKAIYIGCNASDQLIRELSEIGKDLNIKVYKMHMNINDYSLYYNLNLDMI